MVKNFSNFLRKKNYVVQVKGLVKGKGKSCDLGQRNNKIKHLPKTKIFNFVRLIPSLMNNMDYNHSQTQIQTKPVTNAN